MHLRRTHCTFLQYIGPDHLLECGNSHIYQLCVDYQQIRHQLCTKQILFIYDFKTPTVMYRGAHKKTYFMHSKSVTAIDTEKTTMPN